MVSGLMSEVRSTGAGTPSPSSAPLPMLLLRPLPINPSVSVLITSYNYGYYLAQAIESALTQSYQPMEVIVADDGSEDDSCEIVESYMHRGEPVKLHRGQHQGMGGSLNAAFALCSGDIVCLLDADDYFLPGKIEAIVTAFREQPEAGFAVHRARMINQHNQPRGIYPLFRALPQGDCSEATLQSAGVLMGLPPTSNLSLRHEVARRIFPIPKSFSGYAEQMIHRMAPLLTSLCAVDEPLSVWRLHERNDGNSARVAPQRLARELSYMQQLWSEQKGYLLRQDAELAKRLPALDSNPLYMSMRYMWLKLTGDRKARQCHAILCAMLEPKHSPANLFWKYSLALPRPVFQKCVDLLQTQSIWKEWMARTYRRLKTSCVPY